MLTASQTNHSVQTVRIMIGNICNVGYMSILVVQTWKLLPVIWDGGREGGRERGRGRQGGREGGREGGRGMQGEGGRGGRGGGTAVTANISSCSWLVFHISLVPTDPVHQI